MTYNSTPKPPIEKRKIIEMPDGLPRVELSENSYQVFNKRYVRKGEDGQLTETPEETFWRVAYHIASSEDKPATEILETAKQFYKMLVSLKFLPNSPTFTGAGTPLGQLAACFVLPISDDMGKKPSGIFQTLRDAALIQQTGGGNGFSFSSIRPSGSLVNSSAGRATGPIGFMRVFDHAFGEVAQGGTRRGANMAVLRIDHPDIESFITCKTRENAITNFNISVGITDAFMQAVENDENWDLRFPDVHHPLYHDFDGTLEEAEAAGIPIITYKQVRARDLYNLIIYQAHHNGEPGMLFLDAANRTNPVPQLYTLQATNPCGEQWLGPYENCCLGSINLARHCGPNGSVDWDAIRESIRLAVRFLDDVVDANKYVPSVPQLRENALRARRIGLGIMGLADLMYHCGICYGSEAGLEFGAQIMEFIRYHSMLTSIELAKEFTPFPAIKGSIYDPEHITWQPPHSIVAYTHDWGRPQLDWEKVVQGIHSYGIRNAAQTTVAPTGTISTVAGCEGYGCEPVFALAYIRHVDDNGTDLELTYLSPFMQAALERSELTDEERQLVVEQILEHGSCQDIDILPESIREIFVVSQDISGEEHVRMQAALQAFVDNSISKTINFPSSASEDDIAAAFSLAWKLGCKGMTVYVTGSRERVVLETAATRSQKQSDVREMVEPGADPFTPIWLTDTDFDQPNLWSEPKKPRPRFLAGMTYGIKTPVGKTFVTINENGYNQPFEVFINTAKAGSDVAADSEAIARLISYVLRLSSPVEPSQRLQEIWRQLSGLGGGRPLGFGPSRVRSLPDGVAQVLAEYMEQRSERIALEEPMRLDDLLQNTKAPQSKEEKEEKPKNDQYALKIGDLCPECGQAALVNEEGCRKCYGCGYSEC
ncbi:MAG: Ribonucleoside-diphosphate reductase [Anaerolinea thermophila]|uniref:Vitamin B12-dependent ribonucleotide reductase n=1 Tax=Anaerolinea thermophila TaxID=167964 RepID=A0A101FYU4_9CHLR|nr:MAG: Ribonucleoside-diphosphate reductase [Anaerolinea thermophila]